MAKDFPQVPGETIINYLSPKDLGGLSSAEFGKRTRKSELAGDVRAIVLGFPLRPDSPLNASYDPNSQKEPIHSEVTGKDYPNTPYGQLKMRAEETHAALDGVLTFEDKKNMEAISPLVKLMAWRDSLLGTSGQVGLFEPSKLSTKIDKRNPFSYIPEPDTKRNDNPPPQLHSSVTGRDYPTTAEGFEQMRREEAEAKNTNPEIEKIITTIKPLGGS
jgi:hypothetical protein